MSVCKCYHDEENFLRERGVCYGTKEREPCSCGGDESKCDFYPEKRKKQTNADKIRAMTDEEFAEILGVETWCEQCIDATGGCGREWKVTNYVHCINHWLEWLKKEATE